MKNVCRIVKLSTIGFVWPNPNCKKHKLGWKKRSTFTNYAESTTNLKDCIEELQSTRAACFFRMLVFSFSGIGRVPFKWLFRQSRDIRGYFDSGSGNHVCNIRRDSIHNLRSHHSSHTVKSKLLWTTKSSGQQHGSQPAPKSKTDEFGSKKHQKWVNKKCTSELRNIPFFKRSTQRQIYSLIDKRMLRCDILSS